MNTKQNKQGVPPYGEKQSFEAVAMLHVLHSNSHRSAGLTCSSLLTTLRKVTMRMSG